MLNELIKLNPMNLNCSIFSVYDYNGMSMQEILCQFFTKINELIDSQNKVVSLTEWLVNQGLREEVAKQLNQWILDGTLSHIINEVVFNELNEKINNNTQSINNNKIDLENQINNVEQTLTENINNTKQNIEIVESEFNDLRTKFNDLRTKFNNLDVVNIVDFGAIGDGGHDCYQSFINAVDYCKEHKINHIFIPNGLFYTSQGIDTKGIKIIGIGNTEIPFLTWDYTRPNSSLNKYHDYMLQCRGSIITSDKNINIFTNGLFAENIGIFGNRRALNQNGIGQTDGGNKNLIKLNNVSITGCGNNGIYAPYGLISPKITDCSITQNGKHGIQIGKQIGTYTGETNFVNINNNDIVRNESHGIYMDIKGRFININNNDLEQNGEISDNERPKGTDYNNIVYGCFIKIEGEGGFTSGAIDFSNNYSEETLGLFYLESPDNKICQGIKINSNMWRPYNQELYSNGVLLKGWIEGISVENNNLYGKHNLRFIGEYVYGVTSDTRISTTVYKHRNLIVEKHYDSLGNKVDFRNTGRTEMYSLNNLITSSSYDNESKKTRVYFNKSVIPLELQEDGIGNKLIGTTFVDNSGTSIGIVVGFSWTNGLFELRNDRSSDVVNGNAKFMENGGFTTLSGSNSIVKIYVDYDNEIIAL